MSLAFFSVKNISWRAIAASASAVFAFGHTTAAHAANPVPGQLNLSEGANDLAIMLGDFHNQYLLPVCFAVSLLVLLLMAYTCWRFAEKRHPIPSTTTHNVLLEVAWTIVPVLILGVLFIPSMRVLYASEKALDYAFAVKITGNQWYWHYDYPDHDNIGFDSYMIPEDELKPGQKRLMDVDHPLVIPVNTPILLQFTANDVLHNWSVSEFGIRVDTVPGQLSEAPLYPIREIGTYYGFCSELCGELHSYMPITVKVVSQAEFQQWLVTSREQFAATETTETTETLETLETLVRLAAAE